MTPGLQTGNVQADNTACAASAVLAATEEAGSNGPHDETGQTKRKAGDVDPCNSSLKAAKPEEAVSAVPATSPAAAVIPAATSVAVTPAPPSVGAVDASGAVGAAALVAPPEQGDGTRVYSLHAVLLARASVYFRTRLEGQDGGSNDGGSGSSLAYTDSLAAAAANGKAQPPR